MLGALALVITASACSGNEVASPTRTVPPASAAPPGTVAPSVAGQPCVAASDVPVIEGKPIVNVPVGPPPTTMINTDLKVGTGDEVKASDTITVQYVGIACSTGKQFDSSWDNGQPATFSLSGVIPGWTQGIPGMKVGGQRQLVIPPELAYADSPQPGSGIAAGETLIFVIDLVSIGAAPATTVAGAPATTVAPAVTTTAAPATTTTAPSSTVAPASSTTATTAATTTSSTP